MAGLDLTQYDALFKTKWTDQAIREVVYKTSPFFAMLRKDNNFVGDSQKIPLIYEDNQNVSSNFQIANGGTSAVESAAFLLTRKKKYAKSFIDNETLEASDTNEGAFLRALDTEPRSMLRSVSNDICFGLISSGSGSRGVISTDSASTITLTKARDIVNFKRNMILQASATETGGSVRSGSIVIASVNRKAGSFTYTGSIAGLTAGDYLYRAGDYDNEIAGLDAWLPYTNRATRIATAFYGVTRSSDDTRLAGWTEDYSSLPIEEAIIEGDALLSDEGGMPDTCLLNPLDFANLQKSLGSKVQYVQTNLGQEGIISFQGIMVNGAKGTIRVYAERHVPRGRMFLLTLDTWTLHSLGEPVKIYDRDGLRMLRAPNSDGLEMRAYGYMNLACHAPGYNGQFAIQS